MENKKKSTKNWTSDNVLKYTTLFNYMKKKHGEKVKEDTFINDYKRSLMKEIENNTKWGASMKENLSFMVSKWLALNVSKTDRYVKIYSKKGFDLLTESKKKIAENKLDDKEKANYRDYTYFENILNNKDKFGPTIISHYQYLLLACMILQPPLRTDFYRSATLLKKLTDDDGKNNYVYINKQGGKNHVMFIVNKDKATNYRVYKKDKNLSKIEIKNQKLADLIAESFEKYPRKYLFENPTIQDKFNPQTILKYLRNITGLSAINDQMMRSIYITHFYSKNPTYGQKQELAHQMRHSVDVASMNYQKIFDEDEKKEINKPSEIVELKKENFELNEKLKKCEEQKKGPNEALYNKRRSDILYRYNLKGVQPTEKTMLKYNIKFDNEKKKYI